MLSGSFVFSRDDVATGRLASDLRHKKDVESVEQYHSAVRLSATISSARSSSAKAHGGAPSVVTNPYPTRHRLHLSDSRGRYHRVKMLAAQQ
jgi:hypothetical protein